MRPERPAVRTGVVRRLPPRSVRADGGPVPAPGRVRGAGVRDRTAAADGPSAAFWGAAPEDRLFSQVE
ncbi:hypothetical protein GCM10009605_36160 [Nocardiopsis composta]